MIAIIDYKAGNILSVGNALRRLGADFTVSADRDLIRSSDRVILPGVGEASTAMQELLRAGPGGESLSETLRSLTCPVLGICIGVQLMSVRSVEGDTECMGIFPTSVRRFPSHTPDKVPQIGWNTIGNLSGPLFRNIPEGSYVYYVHSYYPELCPGCTVAETEYAGTRFSAALQKDNFFGTQFHPEKSGSVGALILKNFLEI